jgi:hypothetical protein
MKKKTASPIKPHSVATFTSAQDSLENLLKESIDSFVANNGAATVVADGMRVIGIGLRPVIDRITFRTTDIDKRAEEFICMGFAFDSKLGIVEFQDSWTKVFRRSGYPAICLEQVKGKSRNNEISESLKTFGDKIPYHMAVLVDDIEQAVFFLEKQGVPMYSRMVGNRGDDFRQAFTLPQGRKNKPFTILELTERHHGYQGFLAPRPKE